MSNWSRIIGLPTFRLGTDASVISAESCDTVPLTATGPLAMEVFELPSAESMPMPKDPPSNPWQSAPEVGTRIVSLAPAPRNVTLEAPEKQIPLVALPYVPAPSKTTPPPAVLQLVMAVLICAVVALDVNVAQILERFGIPPATPAWLQLVAREEASITDHGYAND